MRKRISFFVCQRTIKNMNAEIDISNTVLHTERLVLRPWTSDDLDDLFAYASVDGVGQMAGWSPHKDIEESRQILEMFINGKKTFALEYQGKVIGSLGIEKYREDTYPEFKDLKCREIGYVLAKDYWGRGLMPEAVREVIRWLFDDCSLDVLFCGCFLTNKQSKRVIEKCGFEHYAFGIFHTFFDTEEPCEDHILRKEHWMERTSPLYTVCGQKFRIRKLLGHGKGGWSWLAEKDGAQYVLKQIHHEPCDYYSFGDKIQAEQNDYQRLRQADIRIPEMFLCDTERERIVKEYISGETIHSLVQDHISAEPYFEQVREMAAKAKAAGFNIDYYPTNFVVHEGLLWYIDYECSSYSDEWNFENWGIQYWN